MKILFLLLLLIVPSVSHAAVFYIRVDGSDDTKCSGVVDAPYPGSGINQACAYSHPYYALRVRNSYSTGKFVGGDTMIIDGYDYLNSGAQAQYMMGDGAPLTGNGSGGECSHSFPSDCRWALPSGTDVSHPTRILGKGYDTLTGNKPQLYGVGNIYDGIINAYTKNYIDIEWLDITDHEQNMVGPIHFNPAYTMVSGARRGLYMYKVGYAILKNLEIHGLAQTGVFFPGANNWSISHVNLNGNGHVGWDGDSGLGSAINNQSGTMKYSYSSVKYTGCVEAYPYNNGAIAANSCVGQGGVSQYYGGYGDAFGFGDGTMANWVIDHADIRYNTSDGFDGLHGDGSGFNVISNSIFEGDAGQEIKVVNPTTIVNSFVIGNCYFFANSPLVYNDGVHSEAVPYCRAGATTMSWEVVPNAVYYLYGNTFLSTGDILLYTHGSCNSNTKVYWKNNIIIGGKQWNTDATNDRRGDDGSDLLDADTERADFNYYDGAGCTTSNYVEDYNIIYDTKSGSADKTGAHSIYADPIMNTTIKRGPANTNGYYYQSNGDTDAYLNFKLGATSIGRYSVRGANTADETLACGTINCGVDYNLTNRGVSWDTGAVQYGTAIVACTENPGACTGLNTCCSSACTSNICESGGSATSCLNTGNACTAPAQCCSLFCCAGACSAGECPVPVTPQNKLRMSGNMSITGIIKEN